jgi:hypothetical protein
MRCSNQQIGARGTVLVVGSNGGAGTALLRLLERPAIAARHLPAVRELLLLDREPAPAPVSIACARQLPPEPIESREQLAAVLRRHSVDQLIELSGAGTLDCVSVCEALEVDLLTAGVQEWPNGRPIALVDSVRRLLERGRPPASRASCLIGAGMNPGVVNALALCAIDRFAERVGVAPHRIADGLHAVLLTEHDTTRASDEDVLHDGDAKTFALTWSPTHALEELLEDSAIAARGGSVFATDHAPTAQRYRARCGHRIIEGMLVPHEEVITLARRLPASEIAFVYRLPRAARRALASHPQRTAASDWPMRKLYPPHTFALEGGDCVGVLLCSQLHGELWLGFDTDSAAGLAYGTNATELQVAAGLLAGLRQLGALRGVHFVEDLDVHAYCRAVETILGPAHEVYDPQAPPRSLAQRRVAEVAAM